MLNLFNRHKQLLDEEIIEWIFACFSWTLKEFDQDVFFNETQLVIPDNKHFPGKETTANGMANLIFEQVKNYAGMAHWPTRLFDLTVQPAIDNSQTVFINGDLRGKNAQVKASPNAAQPNPLLNGTQQAMPLSSMPMSSFPQPQISQNSYIAFGYHPQQLKSPEGIIAYFAHGLSHHLAGTAKTQPPGGESYLPMAGEITGIFMGFGIMFANSAIIARAGGCGGCGGGQSPVREVILSEQEATYALALFCHLKSIEYRQVARHLKKHLRGFFKDALKDCQRRSPESSSLQLEKSVTD
ncbi:hypothetical protein [Aliikangiella maris]|uniref:Uncharacterized protein n=2 Tax=Aliikangiella maris TaxID=3162458 RepID=A0ABV2BW87_9GAMM